MQGCLTSSPTLPKEAEEKRVFWGNKMQVIDFLNSPSAKADRWIVEALGQ